MIDIEKRRIALNWELDTFFKKYGKQYEKVMDIMLNSKEQGGIKCMIACKA